MIGGLRYRNWLKKNKYHLIFSEMETQKIKKLLYECCINFIEKGTKLLCRENELNLVYFYKCLKITGKLGRLKQYVNHPAQHNITNPKYKPLVHLDLSLSIWKQISDIYLQ